MINLFLNNTKKNKKENSKFEYLYIELENQEKYIKKEDESEEKERGIIILEIL